MEGDGSQPTQATQNVLDPRRIGKQNSGFSDDDISDIICVLYPHSDYARQEILRMAREDASHIAGKQVADIVEPNYEKEDMAKTFQLSPSNTGDYAIILRLSAQVKDPLHGFTFGRNPTRCDVCFGNDPLRRLSNIHFRIYVNEYGVVMLEDQSTNGTLVEGRLLRARSKIPNEVTDTKTQWALTSGDKIKVLMHVEANDLELLVRIPRREGEYDRAYISKLESYFEKLDDIREEQAETIAPDPRGRVDLFPPPRARPQPARQASRRIALPDVTTQENLERFPREWDGSDRYNRVGQIGKGAFAVVYKVTSKFDGNPYAAKELDKRRFMKNGILDQKVDNEMKIMQQVQHPHVVRYIEHFDWDNRLFIIIMEYVAGGDLGRLISDHGPLPEQVVQVMATQLLSALGYLHEKNITHRDVKPDNILIHSLKPLDVKLTDFGLSKIVDNEQTFLRTFCGTLLYCAPEVYSEYAEYDDRGFRHPRNRAKRAAVGQRYDHAVDVWSLGGVLFYAMTGSPPYPVRSGISYSELLHQIMTTPLNTNPVLQHGISRQGVDFLIQMLQRRPESRATVRQLEHHPWLGGPAAQRWHDDDQSLDEITDDDELQVEASQLSLQEGQSRQLADADPHFDDIVEDTSHEFSDDDSQKENYTFGFPVQQPPRLFGEVNVSAVGSSGVIPADMLNLPAPGRHPSFGSTEILETEIQDSYGSDDISTPRRPSQRSGGAMLNLSIANGQSADQLQSLVENVASQSLGGTESVIDDLHMRSLGASYLNGSDFNTSKRKPSHDTSDEFELETRTKPIFKRLKSEGNMDTLADDVVEEYILLASVPQVKRRESGRQIDGPYHKMFFWERSNLETWHLQYPEMTQLQYDVFQQAADERIEEFGPGKTPLWDLAMKYFPPSSDLIALDDTEVPATTRVDAPSGPSRTTLRRDDRKMAAGNDWDIPATAPQEPEENSLPDTLPPDTQMIVVPVHRDDGAKRAVAVLESDPSSVVSGISVPISDPLVSWGRGPENTIIFEPKTEQKVPKYAVKIQLWKEGYDPAKDPSKYPHPWERDANPDGFAFYLSTKATSGVKINQVQLPSHDCKNPSSPSQNWVRLHDGDVIVIWGGMNPENGETKIIFRCFWGASASPRADSEPLKLVSATMARKLDDASFRTEKRIKTRAEERRLVDEADKDVEERLKVVERERQRSRVFEQKRVEAQRYLAMRNASRRGSPASVTQTTTGVSTRVPGLGITTQHVPRVSPEK